VQHLVEFILVEKVIGIIKCDEQYTLLFLEDTGDRVKDLLEGSSRRRREMAGEFPVDLGKDGKLSIVDLAVDMDRHQFFCRLFDLLKEFFDTGRFAGTGQAFADRIEGAPAPEPRPYLEREFAHLG